MKAVMLYTEKTSFVYYPIHSNTPTLTSPLSPSFQPLIHTQSQIVTIEMKIVMLYTEEN